MTLQNMTSKLLELVK